MRLTRVWSTVLALLVAVGGAALLRFSPEQSQSIVDKTGAQPPDRPQKLAELRASRALELIRQWSSRFGMDIYYGTREATCVRSMLDKLDPSKSDIRATSGDKLNTTIRSVDWPQTHAEIVKTISTTMGWHQQAVQAIASASEALAGNHSFNDSLRHDYIDVHRLYDLGEPDLDSTDSYYSTDEAASPAAADQSEGQPSTETGERLATPAALVAEEPQPQPIGPQTIKQQSLSEWQTPIKFLKLQRHPNFGEVPINTEESAVHVPVHIFPGEPNVMNGIAWSEELTKTFQNNFLTNPRLINQYFASQSGFLRLFPAQQWQIPRADPDLYDARVRPWYVAAASSRKDVIILVDSSGSMTGSRRDIAKGVVFEILDTLTDNDHFLILKFNDVVQQVGVPACPGMRLKRDRTTNVPLKNVLFHGQQAADEAAAVSSADSQRPQPLPGPSGDYLNGTDVDSLYLLPANGRNVRHIKTNFTIPTSGIANFSRALVTAFEVLRKYQDTKRLGSQCNQAIMLVTDGSPSDFSDIFDRYNIPNAPVRVFTYLIGREANDGSHTKMMACHNRGYYTHVINLAEVRETIQQYIPVMARPLVLNRTHPVTWTPAYAELTYQILTDWIWESRRREQARAILAAGGVRPAGGAGYVPNIRVSNMATGGDSGAAYEPNSDGNPPNGATDESGLTGEQMLENELEALDLFGYQSNPDCFWETRRNDLLTTVVQPVYDTKNESRIVEKFLNKNIWFKKETMMRTANLLGVAAADMRINDIVALAPSHRLGPNGYAILLTNNGLVMHHPDLRATLEPFSFEQSSQTPAGGPARDPRARILKPFFSSLDFTQVEHILNATQDDARFLELRQEAVAGLTGWRELTIKRAFDCQRRVQTRRQSFYYKRLLAFPFAFLVAIPTDYGDYKLEAQVEIKSSSLPERLTTYFTTSDDELWTVHPDYQYCDGPSNNTVASLLDLFQRVDRGQLDDIEWRPLETNKPPVFLPGKLSCDKTLVQSLVYDAYATFGFADMCSPPSLSSESSLLGMYGIRFSFVATRSGLTRVRHYDNEDPTIKREALAFARKHSRAIDETFYARTVDFNMLTDENSVLVQVPFNLHEKIRERLDRYDQDQAISYDEADESSDNNLEGEDNSTQSDASNSTRKTSAGYEPFPPSARVRVRDMNLLDKLNILANSSLHVIATQSLIVKEGARRSVAGVTGSFYDYASFVMRLVNASNFQFQEQSGATRANCAAAQHDDDPLCDNGRPADIQCGLANDTIDCLLVDNNGYILASEDLEMVGRHLKAYDAGIMNRLLSAAVFHEINITDYQSICLKQEERQTSSSSSGLLDNDLGRLLRTKLSLVPLVSSAMGNMLAVAAYLWTLVLDLAATPSSAMHYHHQIPNTMTRQQQHLQQPILALIPNKTYLRPCERVLTRYEMEPSARSSSGPEFYTTLCECNSWFVYQQVPRTNLMLLIVDSAPGCRDKCDQADQLRAAGAARDSLNTRYNIVGSSEEKVCSMVERESKLYRDKIESCFSQHPDEEQIKICGSADRSQPIDRIVLLLMVLICTVFIL